MANSSASLCEPDFYQPEVFATQTLKLISSMLKQVVATLDAHVELLQQEHVAADQLRERQLALIGVDGAIQTLDHHLEQIGKNKTNPASQVSDRGPGQA